MIGRPHWSRRAFLGTLGLAGAGLALARPRLGLAASRPLFEELIKWPAPSGRVERIENPPVDGHVRIVEGKGIVS